jgi:hypothetical protein
MTTGWVARRQHNKEADMTWALHHSDTRLARTRTVNERTATWPRGLTLVAIVSLLVAGWGAIVPFLGPAIGFDAASSVGWQWSAANGWLYVLPGAVAFSAGLLLLSRARSGWGTTRLVLALSGVLVFAAGVWFAFGPWGWAALGHAAAFSTAKSSFGTFVTLVGYNLGVGVVLAALGGMMLNAGMGERALPAAMARTDNPVVADRPAAAPPSDTVAPPPTAVPEDAVPAAGVSRAETN